MTDYTERDVLAALFTRFNPPEFMGFTQVRNGDERGVRMIDFMAVGMYPSKGHPIHAVEVKVNRSDWLDEIENPGKHAYFETMADYFWVATAPDVVRGEHEVPQGWGWLKMHGDILHRKVAAKKRPSPVEHKPFLAVLLRHAEQQRNDPAKGQILAAQNRARRAARQDFKAEQKSKQWTFKSDQQDALKIKEAFREHGIPLGGYNADRIAKTLAPVWDELQAEQRLKSKLEDVRDRAQHVVDTIQEALDEDA